MASRVIMEALKTSFSGFWRPTSRATPDPTRWAIR